MTNATKKAIIQALYNAPRKALADLANQMDDDNEKQSVLQLVKLLDSQQQPPNN